MEKMENLYINEKKWINNIESDYNFDGLPNLDIDLKDFKRLIDRLVDLWITDFSWDIDMKEKVVDEFVFKKAKKLDKLLKEYDKWIDEDGIAVKEFLASLINESELSKQLQDIVKEKSNKNKNKSKSKNNWLVNYFTYLREVPRKLINVRIEKTNWINEVVSDYNFDGLPNLDNDLKKYKKILEQLIDLWFKDFSWSLKFNKKVIDKFILKKAHKLDILLENYDKWKDENWLIVKDFIVWLTDISKITFELYKLIPPVVVKRPIIDTRRKFINLRIKKQKWVDEILSDYDFTWLPNLDSNLHNFKKLINDLVNMWLFDFSWDINLKEKYVDKYIKKQSSILDKVLEDYDKWIDEDWITVKEFLVWLNDRTKQSKNLKKLTKLQ